MITLVTIEEEIKNSKEVLKQRATELRKILAERKALLDGYDASKFSDSNYQEYKSILNLVEKTEEFVKESSVHFKFWEMMFRDILKSKKVIWEGAEARDKNDFLIEIIQDLQAQNETLLQIVQKRAFKKLEKT